MVIEKNYSNQHPSIAGLTSKKEESRWQACRVASTSTKLKRMGPEESFCQDLAADCLLTTKEARERKEQEEKKLRMERKRIKKVQPGLLKDFSSSI